MCPCGLIFRVRAPRLPPLRPSISSAASPPPRRWGRRRAAWHRVLASPTEWGERRENPGGCSAERSRRGRDPAEEAGARAEGAEFLPLRPECSARGRCRGCGPHRHVLAPRLPPLRPSISSATSPHLDGGGDEEGPARAFLASPTEWGRREHPGGCPERSGGGCSWPMRPERSGGGSVRRDHT